MSHAEKIRLDYSLSEAFHALGCHLFQEQWSGYEIEGRREENPEPVLRAREPLENKAEELCRQINQKKRELKTAVGRKAIQQINAEITHLENQRGQVYAELNSVGEVHKSVIEDHGRWERFEQVEGILLQAFMQEELKVFCLRGMIVQKDLWAELPDDFGYDFDRSLIYWPARNCARRMDVGFIKQEEFEAWLENQIPLGDCSEIEVSDFVLCKKYLKEQIIKGKNKTKAEYYEEACVEIPGLSLRAFNQAWSEMVPDSWKSKGRPRNQ